jgi:zinc D-Ala-D-Ala carboxypeptidase
MAWKYFKLA